MTGGIILDFMIGKLALTLGVFTLLGCTFSLAETSEQFQENQQFEVFLSQISETLEVAGSLPGEVEIEKKLPALPGVEVRITGELDGGVEKLRIVVEGDKKLTREVRVPVVVNGGRFQITSENPVKISLHKDVQELKSPIWFLLSRFFGRSYAVTIICLEVQ